MRSMEHLGTLEEITHCLQAVIDFAASRRFGPERRAALTEFFGRQRIPRGSQPEREDRLSSYLDWFLFDRTLRETGQSLVRQFVVENPDLPARIRENLLQCEQSIYSSFEVKEIKEHCVVVLDLHGEPHDYYAVEERTATSDLAVGDIITTRLIRWDQHFYFYGLIERWPQGARALFHQKADLLRETRLDPRWRQRLALEIGPSRSRRGWLRRKRRGG